MFFLMNLGSAPTVFTFHLGPPDLETLSVPIITGPLSLGYSISVQGLQTWSFGEVLI